MSKYSRQQIKKLHDGQCLFCKEDDYTILDAHRIVPGTEGGEYHNENILTVCANCHRLIHSGSIVIDRKYLSTNGKLIVHYWRGEEEFWEYE